MRRRPPCASTRSPRPAQARAAVQLGASDAVVRDLDHERPVARRALIAATAAPACLTAFASPSHATKYAAPRPPLRAAPPARRPSARAAAPGRERLERGGETLLGEDRRMHAARELAQLADGDLQLIDRGVEHSRARAGRRRAALGGAQLQRERDEPLLRAVVEVPLDPAPLGVAGRDDPRPRPLDPVELRAELGARGARSRARAGGGAGAPTSSGPSRRPGSSTRAASGAPSLSEPGDRTALAVGRQRDRVPVRVDVAVALRQPERDLEVGSPTARASAALVARRDAIQLAAPGRWRRPRRRTPCTKDAGEERPAANARERRPHGEPEGAPRPPRPSLCRSPNIHRPTRNAARSEASDRGRDERR